MHRGDTLNPLLAACAVVGLGFSVYSSLIVVLLAIGLILASQAAENGIARLP